MPFPRLLLALLVSVPVVALDWDATGTVQEYDARVAVVAEGTAGTVEEAQVLAAQRAKALLAEGRRVGVTSSRSDLTRRERQGDGVTVTGTSESATTSQANEVLDGLTVRERRVMREADPARVRVLVEMDADDLWPGRELVRLVEAPQPAADRRRAILALAERRYARGRVGAALEALAAGLAAIPEDAADRRQRATLAVRRAVIRADQGQLTEAEADLVQGLEDAQGDPALVAEINRLRTTWDRAAGDLAGIVTALREEAARGADDQAFAIAVEGDGPYRARWVLKTPTPRMYLQIAADATELEITEPLGTRPVSGSGSLTYGPYPAGTPPFEVWLWAIDPASPVLAQVRAMSATRVSLAPGQAPPASRREWQGLLTALRRHSADTPTPAVRFRLPPTP